ncbi:MAG: hypothetical protein JXO22_08230, partial [Phycisphaerae bacterium]|nr:hypothetical protein [Phycisphaerae bacterium]
NAPVYSVTFSPDGSQVLSGGGDARALLWNVVDGSIVTTFSGHANSVVSTAFAPDGATVATGARDAVARIWDSATGAVIRRMQPCDSTISAVDFSPDGTQMLAAVAAANSVQLDTPEPQGNDMNLTTPQPLSLDVPEITPGTYFLWAELDTDRTSPARTYAPTVIQVLDPLPAFVIDPNDPTSAPPQVTLINNSATVIVAPTIERQIFDIGAMSLGDRIIMSFASLPGYGEYYSEPKIAESTGLATRTSNTGSEGDGFYSLMLLDREQDVLAWYQDSGVLFSPDAKIVVGANNSSHYFATDTATSVNIQVVRNAGLTPRQQRVYLNFEGGTGLVIAGSVPFDISPLTDILLNTGVYTEDQIKNDIKRGIVTRVRTMLAPYNVQVTCSEGDLNDPADNGAPPASPYQQVYFGGTFVMDWDDDTGLYDLAAADYVDPRNETLTGTGAVSVDGILGVYGTGLPAAGTMGLILGNATAYDIGFLLGLRRTEGTTNDIMDLGVLWGYPSGATLLETSSPAFGEGALRAYEQYGTHPPSPTSALAPIGIQDAPTLFQQLIGPAP